MKHILAILVFMFGTGIVYAGHLNVTLNDLLLLAESGVSDKTFLAFIEPREITFTPGTEEIAKLRKAGLSEEVIQYLLANNRQAGLTYNRYINPPVAYSYPRYYYGSSLYLGFGRGHHALFDNHFVGLDHSAPHHTGLYHGASFNVIHSGSTGGHQIGHSSYHGVNTTSTGINSSHSTSGSNAHTAGLNISHSNNNRSHSTLGRSSHNTIGISALSSRHGSNRSHSTLGRSSHNTIGISALSSRHGSNRSHSTLGSSSHNTTSRKAHSTNRGSSHHSSSLSGSHGGSGHGGGH
jgi:hypothetical protein